MIGAWIAKAIRRARLIKAGLAAVAEWEAEHGGFSEEEIEAARRRVASELA